MRESMNCDRSWDSPRFRGWALWLALIGGLILGSASARADQPGAVGDAARGLVDRRADRPFPVGRMTLDLMTNDAFERAMLSELRRMRVTLAEYAGADGRRVYDHPRMVGSVGGRGAGTVISVEPFGGEPLNAFLTRGALLAIDGEARRILTERFGLMSTPGLGIEPIGGRFASPSSPDSVPQDADHLLAIPAELLRGHGERARRIWIEFFSDLDDKSAGFPDLELAINEPELDAATPPAWGRGRFDVGRFDVSLHGLPDDAEFGEALRSLRVELGLIGPDESPLFVYPGTGGERVLVRVFDGSSARGTYSTGAFVAIDAAVRRMADREFGIGGVVIAPTPQDGQGRTLWASDALPASAAAGTAGFATLGAPDATGAERTWTLFSNGRARVARDPAGGEELPALSLDLLGRVGHPLIDGDPISQRYRVSRVQFVYPDLGRGVHPELPPINEVLSRVAIPLMRVDEPAPGWVAARPGSAGELVPVLDLVFEPADYLYASAGRAIAIGVQQAYAEFYGWVGHFVQVDPRQVDPSRATRFERDQDTLRFWIQSIEVDEIRTVARAENERVRGGTPTVNNPIHQGILERSPVRPRTVRFGETLDEDGRVVRTDAEVVAGSIPKFRELEEYAARLNRHPGRRVDPVVTPGSGPGLVGIDYLVSEVKPWLILGEVSNTGTKETNDWRYRIGFLHTQLTGTDDILQIDYLTAGFDESHAVIASYQRPIIPDRLWVRVYGNYSEYTASDVGLAGIDFDGESYQFGGELIYNVFQYRDLFIDVLGGGRYENVKVYNGAADDTGRQDYGVAYAGARLERSHALSSSFASVRVETSLNSLDADEAQLLGRSEPDRRWTVMRYDGSHSFFLEPLLNPRGFNAAGGRVDDMTLAHQITLTARGQVAFGNRLLPNEQQTAGGFFTVRGYPESLLAGDSVYLFSGEYRYYLVRSLPAVGLSGGEVAQPFGNFQFRRTAPYGAADWDLLFRAFADYAIVRSSDANVFELEDELFGIGIGAELLVRNNLSVRLDWGFAINEIETSTESVDQWDNRLHFSATVRF